MKHWAARTHVGRVREHNEDCHAADQGLGLWLVADGVGGHAHGEVAAQIVRDTIRADLAGGAGLEQAVRHAHDAVLEEIAGRDRGSNMGSTVVALQLRADQSYEIVWVGDSRAYLFDGSLRQLTRDHNPVSELVASGRISAEQAAGHPDRHVLSQSLGVSSSTILKPGVVQGQLLPLQQILLCSDGLNDELPDAIVSRLLDRHTTVDDQADALVQAALEAGGRDNITVILVGEAVEAQISSDESVADLETTLNAGRLPLAVGRGVSRNVSWLAVAVAVALALAVFIWW